MPARILDGKSVALEIGRTVRDDIASYRAHAGREPSLAIVRVGDDQSARAYQRAILRTTRSVGLRAQAIEFAADTGEPELLRAIDDLNADDAVDGVIILQPLPDSITSDRVTGRLDPAKDVDGVTFENAGLLFLGDSDALRPSTPAGGMALLRHYAIETAGRHAVVVGRSPIVGRPMALMLLAADATVTICHSRTPDLARHTREADILVAAAGRPELVRASMVKPNATVVDFGVSFRDGRLVGDVSYDEVSEVAGAITPVPGGTGRVTTMVVVENTVRAARRRLFN